MMRNIGGMLAGIVAGFIAVLAAQYVSNIFYPLPAEANVFDRAQMTEIFRTLPPAHFAAILVTYLIGGFVGALVARLIADREWPVWVGPVLIMVAAALNVFSYPHPVWAQIGGIAAPLIGAWLALRVPVRRRSQEPAGTVDAEV